MNEDINADLIGETIRSKFNFRVAKYPLYGVDNMKTPLMGLFREDTCAYVGKTSVTDRYTPHTTEDVIALSTAAAAAFDGEVSLGCHWNHGHYVSIAPSDDYRESIFGTSDNVFPRLLIQASYNGKAFQATLGYYRDLCRNMAMLESAGSTHVSIKHTHSLRSKMDSLICSMQGLREGWRNLTDTIRIMQDREVNLAEFLKTIYGEPDNEDGRSRTIHRNRTETIVSRVWNERERSGRSSTGSEVIVSAWEAFNGVQGYAQHDASRKRNPNDFDRILLSINDKHVQAAERLALAI